MRPRTNEGNVDIIIAAHRKRTQLYSWHYELMLSVLYRTWRKVMNDDKTEVKSRPYYSSSLKAVEL